jgi:hypothetical protein
VRDARGNLLSRVRSLKKSRATQPADPLSLPAHRRARISFKLRPQIHDRQSRRFTTSIEVAVSDPRGRSRQ